MGMWKSQCVKHAFDYGGAIGLTDHQTDPVLCRSQWKAHVLPHTRPGSVASPSWNEECWQPVNMPAKEEQGDAAILQARLNNYFPLSNSASNGYGH